ncbi:MAG: DUF2505 family protein [Acidimicrobiales bacterium]
MAVRFHTEHTFAGSEQAVAALLSDPAFYLELTLPDLEQPEVLEQGQDGAAAIVRLRYEFVGSIDPIARRLIGSDRLSWIQEVRVDRSTGSGALRFEAEKSPKQLHGAGTFTLTPTDGGCVRSLDGELVVAVPGIGRMAERRIVPGVIRRLDIEAQAVNDQLA